MVWTKGESLQTFQGLEQLEEFKSVLLGKTVYLADVNDFIVFACPLSKYPNCLWSNLPCATPLVDIIQLIKTCRCHLSPDLQNIVLTNDACTQHYMSNSVNHSIMWGAMSHELSICLFLICWTPHFFMNFDVNWKPKIGFSFCRRFPSNFFQFYFVEQNQKSNLTRNIWMVSKRFRNTIDLKDVIFFLVSESMNVMQISKYSIDIYTWCIAHGLLSCRLISAMCHWWCHFILAALSNFKLFEVRRIT